MNEKSCRKCGVIGVWGREAAEGRGGAKMCVWAKNVCGEGRKMCVERDEK